MRRFSFSECTLLIGIFVFGVIHSQPAVAIGIEFATKSCLPTYAIIIQIDNVASTNKKITKNGRRKYMFLGIDRIYSSFEPVHTAIYQHWRFNFLMLKVNSRWKRRFVQINQPTANLYDLRGGVSGIDVAKRNREFILFVRNGIDEFEAIDDNSRPVRRNELFSTEFQLINTRRPQIVGTAFESERKDSNEYGGDRRNQPAMSFEKLRKERNDVIGSAYIIAIALFIAAMICIRGK